MTAAAGSTQIVVVGLGACTPLAANASLSAAALRTRCSRLVVDARFFDSRRKPVTVGKVAYVSDTCLGSDRLATLTLVALTEALASIPASHDDALAVHLALPSARPGLSETIAAEMSQTLNAAGRFDIRCEASGHAGGLAAIHHARAMIARGEEDLVMVGGVDSYLEVETIDWLAKQNRLVSRGNISGFAPGEAAGFCLLAGAETARKYAMKVLAHVEASGVAE